MSENNNTMTFSIDKERDEYHLRKKKRKKIRFYIALVIWVVIITFLCTPFATYKMMHVNGNVFLSEEEIINYANIKNVWWWSVDGDKVKNRLESHEKIDNVSISFTLKGLHISILEKYPLVKYVDNGKEYYITNTSFNPISSENCDYSEYKLIDISALDESKRNDFTKEYSRVSRDIREMIFELKKHSNEDYVILKGKLDENVYFDIEINLDYLSFKLDERKFNNIKAEILGKISGSNVEYGIDNPIYVRYNLTDINEFEIVEVD